MLATLLFRIVMTRSAIGVMAVLCVTTITVMPPSRQALCKSEVNVTVEDTAVQLHLRDCTLQSLADADDDLQGFLCAELQHAFAALTNDAKADFFHLQFWHENLYGVGREAPAPTLAVVFE